MNTKRLLKLADHLETVPRSKFYLSVWSCGTQACAIGHACSIPSFKRAGLKLKLWFGILKPSFDNQTGFSAAMAFFDLTWPEIDRLFAASGPSDRTTPKQVAKRIREFVKGA